MDIVLQQTSNCEKFQPEDETFCIVNKILQELIDEVENIVINSEYQNGFSVERSHLSVNESQPDSPIFIPNIQDSFRNQESESRPYFEQPNLSDLRDEGIYLQSKRDTLKCTEYQSHASLDEPVPSVEDGWVDDEKNQEDLRNAAKNSGSTFEQPNMSFQDVQTNHEDSYDSDSSNDDFVDTLESVDPIDVRADSDNEWVSAADVLNSRESLLDAGTETDSTDSDVDMELSDESSDIDSDDDGEFIAPQPPEDIGDQLEVGDLDDESFIERVVRYIRDTDMLLVAKRGGGDNVVFEDVFEDDLDDAY